MMYCSLLVLFILVQATAVPANPSLARNPRLEVHNAECLAFLASQPTDRFDSIVTDPPYGIRYRDINKRHAPIANDERPFVWWLYHAHRVLKEGGGLICFCRWDVQESFRSAIELAGFKVRSQVIWDRVQHGMGDCKATFAPRHDVIWFATKGRGFAFPAGRPKSVIPVVSVPGRLRTHPTEKPVELMMQLVCAVTPIGGLVLDPFMGTGATGVAAIERGFGFVGVELKAGYARIARKRINAALAERRRIKRLRIR